MSSPLKKAPKEKALAGRGWRSHSEPTSFSRLIHFYWRFVLSWHPERGRGRGGDASSRLPDVSQSWTWERPTRGLLLEAGPEARGALASKPGGPTLNDGRISEWKLRDQGERPIGCSQSLQSPGWWDRGSGPHLTLLFIPSSYFLDQAGTRPGGGGVCPRLA